VRAVQIHIRRAAAAGWLRIFKQTRDGKAWFFHLYRAAIPDALRDQDRPKNERAFDPSLPW
jgi:hypothetical protein